MNRDEAVLGVVTTNGVTIVIVSRLCYASTLILALIAVAASRLIQDLETIFPSWNYTISIGLILAM